MRTGVLSTLGAVFAATAFIALFALPFANVETTDHSEGTTTEDTLWLSDVLGADQGAIPGGNPVYLIVAASMLLLGSVAFFIGGWRDGTVMRWVHAVGGIIGAIGAAMSIHAGALWGGRGVASFIRTSGGFDGPPRRFLDTYKLYSDSMELYSSITIIAPLVIMALAILALGCIAFAWASRVPATRRLDAMARRQAWLAVLGALVLSIAFLMPWSAQDLRDPIPAQGEPDVDTYAWSAWDIHVIQDATYALAEETGEAGIIQYGGLSAALGILAVTGILLTVLPVLSLAGSELSGRGQPVYGRLLENASFLTVGALTVAIGTIIVGTFWLYDANDLTDNHMTAVPLIALIPAVAGVYFLIRVLRELLAVDNDLVADDFPEQVSYD